MSKVTAKIPGERILCVLTSPKEEGQPFGVSVYAVVGSKPHRILVAESPRSEISGFLSLLQEGGRASWQIPTADSSDPCAEAGR